MGDTVSQEGVEGGRRSQKGEEGYIRPKDFPQIHLSVRNYAVLTGWKDGQAGKRH